jgi:hypothetical protein
MAANDQYGAHGYGTGIDGLKGKPLVRDRSRQGSSGGQTLKTEMGASSLAPRVPAIHALKLVAFDHVLGHALKADHRVTDQRQAPELAVMLPQHVGSC